MKNTSLDFIEHIINNKHIECNKEDFNNLLREFELQSYIETYLDDKKALELLHHSIGKLIVWHKIKSKTSLTQRGLKILINHLVKYTLKNYFRIDVF